MVRLKFNKITIFAIFLISVLVAVADAWLYWIPIFKYKKIIHRRPPHNHHHHHHHQHHGWGWKPIVIKHKPIMAMKPKPMPKCEHMCGGWSWGWIDHSDGGAEEGRLPVISEGQLVGSGGPWVVGGSGEGQLAGEGGHPPGGGGPASGSEGYFGGGEETNNIQDVEEEFPQRRGRRRRG